MRLSHLLERKVSAFMQDRIGPNRVGPYGLLQPVADGLKFLFKEDMIPGHVDKLFYLLAPAIAVRHGAAGLCRRAFWPDHWPPERIWPQTVEEARKSDPTFEDEVKKYNQTFQFVITPHVDVGIVFVFAVGSLTVYGIILGGWSSRNKYSFLGALRSSAQIISYEIPMGMSVLGVVLLSRSLNLEQIIGQQVAGGWNVLYQPLGFLLFLTSIFAECNRLPFDLPEAEQELVGGFHTEYSALKFGLFFLGEYTHMITTSFLAVILFFGGWHLPGLRVPKRAGWRTWCSSSVSLPARWSASLSCSCWCAGHCRAFGSISSWALAWKVLIPLALANVVCVMVVKHMGWSDWWLLPASVLLFVIAGVAGMYRPARPRTV